MMSRSHGVGTSVQIRVSFSSDRKPMPSTGFITNTSPKRGLPKGPAVLAERFASPVRGATDGDDEGGCYLDKLTD